MKKLITIFLLIICILGVTSSVCYAEVDSNTEETIPQIDYSKYPYFVINGCAPFSIKNSFPLYSDDQGKEIACYVPASYYLQPIKYVNDTMSEVLYNGNKFYAVRADLYNTKLTTDVGLQKFKDNVSPYFTQKLGININNPEPYFYLYFDHTRNEDDKTKRKMFFIEEVESIRFIGLTSIDNTIYYYVEISEIDSLNKYVGYIDPKVTDNPLISFLSIENHPYYVEPKPEEDSEATPEIKPVTPEDIEVPATNDLIKNILIGVICVLCVAIVFITYRPNKKDDFQ